MSLFPTLITMGVTRVDQISRYTLQSAGADDELKIYYRRPDGSTLPKSKKFQFARPLNGASATSSPLLLQAVAELNSLGGSSKAPEHTRQRLAGELEQLEQVMQAKMSELRRQLEQWQ